MGQLFDEPRNPEEVLKVGAWLTEFYTP